MLYVQYMAHSNGYNTFTYYYILFCSIIQSMFQELNKKKDFKTNYVLSSTD